MNPAFTISIDNDWQISSRVTCRAEVSISCGSTHGVVSLTFQPEALRELMRQAAEALDEVDARYDAIRARAV